MFTSKWKDQSNFRFKTTYNIVTVYKYNFKFLLTTILFYLLYVLCCKYCVLTYFTVSFLIALLHFLSWWFMCWHMSVRYSIWVYEIYSKVEYNEVFFTFLLFNCLLEFYIYICSPKCNDIDINTVKYIEQAIKKANAIKFQVISNDFIHILEL